MDGHDGGHGGLGASFGNPGGMHGVADIGHDAHGSHDSHGSHGNRGGGSRGGKTTREAVLLSHNHGQSGQVHFTSSGISNAHASQATTGNDAAIDRQHEVTLVTYEDSVRNCKAPTRTLMVHVTNHGYFDHKSEFTRKAHKRRVIRLDRRVPNRDGAADHVKKGADKCPSGLMSWHAWIPASEKIDMPDGWQPGFTGETWLNKEYWGIAKWDTKHKCWAYDRNARTIIEVARTVWRFDQTGCFETKMTFRVISAWIYYPPARKYGFKVSTFRTHQAAAIALAEEMFFALKAAAPDDMEADLLKLLGGNADVHPDGAYVASKDDEEELVEASVNDDVTEDLNTASDSSSTIDGGIVAPPDTPVEPGTAFDDDPEADLGFAPHSGTDLANVLPESVAITANPTAESSTAAPAPELVEVTVHFPKDRK
jgi:hypothetical protein